MAAVLANLLAQSKCEYVFTSVHDRSVALTANTLKPIPGRIENPVQSLF
jgi:hypothetical protein